MSRLDAGSLQPRRHEPPPGWSLETYEAVTSAIATALVAAYKRDVSGDGSEDDE